MGPWSKQRCGGGVWALRRDGWTDSGAASSFQSSEEGQQPSPPVGPLADNYQESLQIADPKGSSQSLKCRAPGALTWRTAPAWSSLRSQTLTCKPSANSPSWSTLSPTPPLACPVAQGAPNSRLHTGGISVPSSLKEYPQIPQRASSWEGALPRTSSTWPGAYTSAPGPLQSRLGKPRHSALFWLKMLQI